MAPMLTCCMNGNAPRLPSPPGIAPGGTVVATSSNFLTSRVQDDWHDIIPKRTAWGTDGELGWWEVQLRSTDDPRVSVKLKGRMTKVSCCTKGRKAPKRPHTLPLVV